jgi:phosphate transport system substrate-binding protein
VRIDRRFVGWVVVLMGLAVALPALAEEMVKVPDGTPEYKAVSGVSGNLNSIGSDTMNNLMTLWGEGFNKFYPSVRMQVEGKGSSTAPPALLAGTAQLGPMSREMKPTEIDEFEKKFGYKPTGIRVALDALAVFVHKDNPIASLSLEQIDGIFSATHKSGHADVSRWGELGLTGSWDQPMSLYGRNSASGTYGFFKDHALMKGDFKPTVKEQPGSSSVVQGVTGDRFGIGYSGIGYRTSGVRAVPLSAKDGGEAFDGNLENVIAGKYPLGRFLFIYVNKAPGKPLDPLVGELVKFVLSRQGQEVVIKDGFLPLPKAVLDEQLKTLSK